MLNPARLKTPSSMSKRTATFLLVATLLFPASQLSAGGSETPRQMLERMTTAMSQMSYQGTFVYIQGENVETMRITHVSDQNGIRERLVAVSGPPREVLRDSGGIRWVLADDKSVLEDSAFNRSFFPELPLDQRDQASQSYVLKAGKESRIAGHKVRNLKVLPTDKYRYGYSLWLEQHSGLLLKWELIDIKGRSVAKLMFTDLRLGSEVDVHELKPSNQLSKFKTVSSRLPTGSELSKGSPRWQPSRLPPGFELTAHRYFSKNDEGDYEHLVYSDGLAAVSVYIESSPPGDGDNRQLGMKRLGTTHAFTRVTEESLITVIGDVPSVTVRFIANSIEPASS
jgi:sigma-E factor negative regulatory protein RseB